MNNLIEPFRIEMPLGIMFSTVNLYLIPGEQLTLIDCGFYSSENWDFLKKEINKLGYEFSDIEQILITHEHRDHVGLLPEIISATQAIVRAPKALEAWFLTPDQWHQQNLLFTKSLLTSLGMPTAALQSSFRYLDAVEPPKKIDELDRIHFYEAGDLLQIGQLDWEVLHTPGHCPTQFVFWQKDRKALFSSDMLLPITPMPIVIEDPKRAGQAIQALPQLLDSFARLQALDIQTVYTGHGPIFTDANAVIHKQLARIEMRKEECYEAIRSGLSTPYELSRKMYPHQQMPPVFSGLHMVLGYIDLLVAEGRILQTQNENKIIQLSAVLC